jgi:uncharacterized protein (TIGR02246 family)
MRNTLAGIGMLLVIIGMAFVVAAQEPKAEVPQTAPASRTNRPEDERAIQAIVEAFTKAFNVGDAQALAQLYTEDAEIIDEDGHVLRGRDQIQAHFTAAFQEHPGGKIAIEPESLRFLGREAAMEEGRARLTWPQEPTETSRYTALYVLRDGRWLQAHVRDFPDRDLTPHDRLKELEWMLGDWIDESANSVVYTSCQWSDDRNFLLRSYSVQAQGKTILKGTQRIGWDPLTKQFRSWVFDSEGGFGEGFWMRNGNQWIVKTKGVLPDGRISTATNVFTFVSKDMVRWRSVDRTIGDQAIPDLGEIVMVRRPPSPKTQ